MTARRIEWIVVGLLAAAAFAAIAIPARVPAVDLADHARLVSLFVGRPDPALAGELGVVANPVAPYWLFHLVASALAIAFSPYDAARIALALFVGAIPLAIAAWLDARESRPALALLAAPILFGSMTGWGFVGIVAGIPLFALVGASAESLARAPRWRTAIALAALVVALYYAHVFVWAAGVLLLALVLFRRGVPRAMLAPPIAAVALGAALGAAYVATFRATPYSTALSAQVGSLVEPSLARFGDVLMDGGAYGLVDERRPLAIAAWVVLAAIAALGIAERRARPDEKSDTELRYAGAALVALVGALVVTPVAFLLHLRFVCLLGALAPLAIPAPRRRGGDVAIAAAALVALGLVATAARSGLDYADRTECLASLAASARAPGRTISLVAGSRRTPPGYATPVLDHAGLYLAATRGGMPFHEPIYTGEKALRVADDTRIPPTAIMLLHAFPQRYHPDLAAQYDTVLTIPVIETSHALGAEATHFDVATCGDVMLAQRR